LGPISDEWVTRHFDHLSHDLALNLHPTLARARQLCPVAHSDAYEGGFWVLTGYEEILKVAQDWQTWSSELGISVPYQPPAGDIKIMPVAIDPPLQRTFKRLVNAHFTPAKVAPWEEPTRALVNRLIDGFIERGECDFMAEFAKPFPGLAFFDLALHAPAQDLAQVNDWATKASKSKEEGAHESIMQLARWIGGLIARRGAAQESGAEGPHGDVIDAVLAAEIEGRPITIQEAIGTIQLLIFGGLDTTAGVLGMAMLRFCEHPEILDRIREHPEQITEIVEELLRLDGSFTCIGRTARTDTEIAGHQVKEGQRVIMYWASANRDEAEFDDPDAFDPDRERNRHIAFGAGPHRCVGSNLARMNLRVAFDVIAQRLRDIKLQPGAEIDYQTTMNRAPLSVPITFTPGAVLG
jgi:cytochrome P450